MAEYGSRKGNSQQDRGGGPWKTLLYIYMVITLICGCGCIAIGLWMNADPYVKAYFTVLRRSITDNTLASASILLLCCGFIIVGMGILGCCGLSKKSKPMFGGFLTILILIMIMELTVGFLVVVFKDDIHRSLKAGMKSSLQAGYQFDNHLGRGWNFVQVREKCCGVDEAHDYQDSDWYRSVNSDRAPGDQDTQYVPITCCVLQADQDRDPSRVNPQDPQPRDRGRCQEAAQARRGDEFLHERGCFARLLDFIHMHFNTLIGLGLAIGLFQIFGLIIGCIWFRTVDTSRDY